MTNGTGAAGPFSPAIADIVRSAPEATLQMWAEALRKRDIPVPPPPSSSAEELREWLATVLPQHWSLLQQQAPVDQVEHEHSVHQQIREIGDTYQVLKYLEDYGLKIRGYDLLSEEEVRKACMDYLQTDKFLQAWDRARSQDREEADKQSLARRAIYVTGKRLRDQTQQALDTLLEANQPPHIFARVGQLIRIQKDEYGIPYIQYLDRYGVRHVLERCAEFWRTRRDGDHVEIPPPMDVVEDLMALPEIPLPPLVAIIEAPVILEDNTLLDRRGYDPRTGLYYYPHQGVEVAIPDQPTATDIREAVELLQEIFCDFPFDSDASRANTFGALLSAVLRPMIRGCVPMVLLDKPQAGTGASLIADVLSMVACGRAGAKTTAPHEEKEWKKTITSILRSGQTVVTVDNIEGKLFSPSLAAVLTMEIWQDRALGGNDWVTCRNVTVWIGTGNNITLGGDMPRRCYWVRMDAEHARPWQRTGYRHPDLLAWVQQERGRILSAVLSLARAWILAGRPGPKACPLVGSYENWRFTIAGILEFAGIEGFLGNLEAMYEEADTDTPQWEMFLEKWYSIWHDNPKLVAEVHEHLQREVSSTSPDYSQGDRLIDSLPDYLMDAWTRKKSFTRVLGNALKSRSGRLFPNGLRVQRFGMEHKLLLWRITRMSDTTLQGGFGVLGGSPCTPPKGVSSGNIGTIVPGDEPPKPPEHPKPPEGDHP